MSEAWRDNSGREVLRTPYSVLRTPSPARRPFTFRARPAPARGRRPNRFLFFLLLLACQLAGDRAAPSEPQGEPSGEPIPAAPADPLPLRRVALPPDRVA